MRPNDWALINVVAENNRHLNDMPLFIHGLACHTSRPHDMEVRYKEKPWTETSLWYKLV